MNEPEDPYTAAAAAAKVLAERTGLDRHDIAVVLGSGWASAAERLGAPDREVSFSQLGGFASTGVAGHPGLVRSLRLPGCNVLLFLGRVHAYEGHSLAAVVHGSRMAVAAGCRAVVLTNAAGGIDPSFRVGQPVLIADHLNLTGRSPLGGPPPPDGYGSRFVDLSDLYSARLRALIRRAVGGMAEGIYAGLAGPHYETPAEIRMLRTLGADLVGMSTVHEAIAARHLGAEVVGVSLVTNAAAGVGGGELKHAEVVEAGRSATEMLGELLRSIIATVAGG